MPVPFGRISHGEFEGDLREEDYIPGFPVEDRFTSFGEVSWGGLYKDELECEKEGQYGQKVPSESSAGLSCGWNHSEVSVG